ncbi:hypothetical protein SUGI_0590640 [Cryptomeria japonica]|nr:hypothetical protein SUGI_0590640 [Cryptomeria japonica]
MLVDPLPGSSFQVSRRREGQRPGNQVHKLLALSCAREFVFLCSVYSEVGVAFKKSNIALLQLSYFSKRGKQIDLSRLSFAQGNVLVSTHLLLKAIFCAGQRSSFHTLIAQVAQGRYQTLYVTSFIHNYRQELARYPALTTGTQQLQAIYNISSIRA